MTRDEALDKIKKCLALAASPEAHEAAAAMRQAQKLMAQFGLTETDVTLADVGEVRQQAQNVPVVRWEAALAGMVAGAFGCDMYTSTSLVLGQTLQFRRHRYYVFIGVGPAAADQRLGGVDQHRVFEEHDVHAQEGIHFGGRRAGAGRGLEAGKLGLDGRDGLGQTGDFRFDVLGGHGEMGNLEQGVRNQVGMADGDALGDGEAVDGETHRRALSAGRRVIPLPRTCRR